VTARGENSRLQASSADATQQLVAAKVRSEAAARDSNEVLQASRAEAAESHRRLGEVSSALEALT